MLTIIHGEDTNASRSLLFDIKEKTQPLVLDGESITLTDLAQAFDGGSLFEKPSNIVIERFLSRKKGTKEFDSLLAFIQDKTLKNEIFLWEPKELDKTTLKKFPHAIVKQYKFPQTLFLLLDSIKPQTGQNLVKLFHKTLETTEAEMIFYMLVRRIRLLLALSESADDRIDEVKRLAPWQQSKLQKQAKTFPIKQLLHIHAQLFEIEKQLKTGGLAADLSLAIDNLFLEI